MKTRQRIVATAGRVFKKQGYRGSGLDGVMHASGLTVGGFYAHFRSKEALFEESLLLSLHEAREQLLAGLEERHGVDFLRQFARRYLSRRHRDDVAGGCPLPSLTGEVSHAGTRVRRMFASFLGEFFAEMEGKMPATADLEAGDRAIATLALCVGGVALARDVKDPSLSDRILLACRRLAVCEPANLASARDERSGS